MGPIYVGTCAWADHEAFYPPGLRPTERLGYYARHFPIVEVDSTFYRLQPQSNFRAWAARTPDDFVFDVKVYGAMTLHHRQARPGEEDRSEVFKRFLFGLEPLAASGKLRALLFQFPPWFVARPENEDYLAWCREMASPHLLAVEFRHRSWFADERATARTLELLRGLGAVNVVCDEPQLGTGTVPAVPVLTNPVLSIFRFHGRNKATWYKKVNTTAERFNYLYTREELAEYVDPIREHAAAGAEVHVLMNNNQANYAVINAREMTELLSGGSG